MDGFNTAVKLQQTFEDIFSDFSRRTTPAEWEKAVKDALLINPEETRQKAIDYVLENKALPSSAAKAILVTADIRNKPARIAEIYTGAVVRKALERISQKHNVRYSLLPHDLEGEKIAAFMRLASEAEKHIEADQFYLAGKKLAKAEQIIIGHPDIEMMKAKLCYKMYDISGAEKLLERITGNRYAPAKAYELYGDILVFKNMKAKALDSYKKAAQLSANGSVISRELYSKLVKLSYELGSEVNYMTISEDDLRDSIKDAEDFLDKGDENSACEIYQRIIAADYSRFEVYLPLGRIFVKRGELESAEYLADIMLDFDSNISGAHVLKAMVLEAQGNQDDALFYYDWALKNDPDDIYAVIPKQYIIAKKDNNKKAAEKLSEGRKNLENKKIPVLVEGEDDRTHLDSEVQKIIESADEFLMNGRRSEAFYYFKKNSGIYENSPEIKFHKARILYTMDRNAEARALFRELKEEASMSDRASDIIYDIDCKITELDKKSGISAELLPEIYFNAGLVNECVKSLSGISETRMSPELKALKARCEIASGNFTDALRLMREALEDDENTVGIRTLCGIILQSKHDDEEALKMYESAAEREEDSSEAYGLIAALLYNLGRDDDLLNLKKKLDEEEIRVYDVDGYVGLTYINHFKKNQNEAALLLENALNAGSSNIEFYKKAISTYVYDKRYNAAYQVVESGLAVHEGSEDLLKLKSEILLNLGHVKSADTIMSYLLRQNPEDAELCYIQGMIETKKGNERNAIRWLRHAAELETDRHLFAYAYADRCFDIGDKHNAKKYYSRAIELDQTDYISLKRRAVLLEKDGDDDAAIADVRAALRIHPDDAEAFVILGNIVAMYDIEDTIEEVIVGEPDPDEADKASQQNGFDASDAVFDEKTEQASDADSKNDGLSDKISKENTDAATDFNLQKKHSFNISDMISKYESGEDLHANLEDLVEKYSTDPEFYFAKAMKIDPSYRQSYMSMAKFKAEKKEYNAALDYIQIAIELKPSQADAYMLKGSICNIMRNNTDAVKCFKKVVSLEPDNYKAYSYLTKCCNEEGRYREALSAAEQGLKIKNNFLNLYVNKAIALYHLKRYEEAVKACSKVVREYSSKVDVHAIENTYKYRGLSNEKLGNYEKALSDYRKVLRYNPNSSFIKRKIDEIQDILEEQDANLKLTSIIRRKFRNNGDA